jgi:hypothetical protein
MKNLKPQTNHFKVIKAILTTANIYAAAQRAIAIITGLSLR